MAIKIRNKQSLIKKLKELPSKVSKPIKQEVFISAQLIRNSAIKNINTGPRSGAIYMVGAKNSVRSGPGEFPKTDTGQLVKSISTQRLDSGFKSIVGTDLRYGRFLEFGTSNMQARPWLLRSAKENEKKIVTNISSAVRGALKR